MLAMATILIATDRGEDERDRRQAIVRVVSAGIALLIGVIGGAWSANVLLGVVTVLLGAQIAIDLWIVGELSE
jgi:hypothetical protein